MAREIVRVYVAPNGHFLALYNDNSTDDLGPLQGQSGADGADGAPGNDGLDGIDGLPGATGPAGPKGDKGDKGEQGATGAQGLRGATGAGLSIKGTFSTSSQLPASAAEGDAYLVASDLHIWISGAFRNAGNIRGPQGETGAQGPLGDTGVPGPQGIQGAVGPAGATGPAGPKGDTGASGPKGDTGATGPQGLTGPQGATGNAGPSAYVAAQAGGFSGTEAQWLASLKGAKGDTGAQGPQGIQGAKGDTGAAGAAGAQGAKGDTGAAGAQGVQGPKGDTGATGAKGDTGAAGTAGPAGATVQFTGTSSTSQVVEGGIKTFTTQAGLGFAAGSRIRVAYTSDPVNVYMDGNVTAYSGTSLSLGVDGGSGAGTFADWNITLLGPKGPQGAAGAKGDTGATGASGTTDYNALSNKPIIPSTLSALSDVQIGSPSDGQVLKYSSASAKWLPGTDNIASGGSGGATKTLSTASWLWVQDEKPAGNMGGSSVAGVNVRVLNTVKENTISGATLSNNVVTLPAGTYYCDIASPFSAGNNALAYLRNESNSAMVLLGSAGYNSTNLNMPLTVKGVFTLTATTNLSVVCDISTAVSTNGLGWRASRGQVEVYTQAYFWKVA